MKFKGRDFIFIIVFVFVLIMGNFFIAYAQTKNAVPAIPEKEEPPQKKVANYQTWKLPIYMQENLQWMVEDFNKRFEEKVQSYKKELRTRFTEFKDMPDDAILYLEGGIFIERSDYLRLQGYMRDVENLKNRQLPREVKKDGK